MLTPYVIARNMFDEVFDSALGNRATSGIMNTDIKEHDDCYELAIDLPGVKREDLSAELNDGHLVISATVGQKKESETETTGKYLRRERFVGSFKRSFYVGPQIRKEDIKAKFEQGVLHLFIPKVPATAQIEQKNLIQIDD